MKKPGLLLIASILLFFIQGCFNKTDEEILREEFDIPESVKTVSIKSSPEKGGWFGREGLKINAVFKFNDNDFREYINTIEKEPGWQPLPPTKEFLTKMGGIESRKEATIRSYREMGESIPEEGSVYNPTEEQLYENFISRLPLNAENGLYQCRTAGNNILYESKTVHTTLDKDLNDYMFAVMDYDKKELAISVSTNY
jgi:hypothetical protein